MCENYENRAYSYTYTEEFSCNSSIFPVYLIILRHIAIINQIFFIFIQFAQQKETLLSHFIATATNYICRYETNWYHCQENIGKNFSFRIVFLVGKFNPHF